MKLLTLGTRGTDLVLAALQLPRKFSRAELNEGIAKLRRTRGDVLSPTWTQGTSNELHRIGSDFAQFHKERRQLDLIARVGSGQYCIRDEARRKLIDAANEGRDLLVTHNTLVVPADGDDVGNVVESHVIGKYAQQTIMTAIRNMGYRIVDDTSSRNAYDFMFQSHERCATPQLMECKGTRRADGTFGVTHGEANVLWSNVMNYWFGVVYGITVADEKASGGKIFITEPPIFKKWRFTKGFRLERICEQQRVTETPWRLL